MNIDLTAHQPFIHHINLFANPMSVLILLIFIAIGAGALYLTDILSAMHNRVSRAVLSIIGASIIVPGVIMALFSFMGVDGSTSTSSESGLFTSAKPYHGVSYLPTRGSEYDKRFNAALASTYGLKIVDRGTDNVGAFNDGTDYLLLTDLHGDNARKCEQKVISTTDTTQHVAIICNGTEAKKVKAS